MTVCVIGVDENTLTSSVQCHYMGLCGYQLMAEAIDWTERLELMGYYWTTVMRNMQRSRGHASLIFIDTVLGKISQFMHFLHL